MDDPASICKRKHRFANLREAEQHIAKWKKEKEQRSYWCHICRGFHLATIKE